jgi:2-polyprenyl-6-methoxyphenol hydroxylase and related FAD-dependent oxidoreductases
LQQASKALKGFGINKLKDGLVSQRHVVHKTNGEIIGEWGNRKWGRSENKTAPVRSNVHIARQLLRKALYKQINKKPAVLWNHQLKAITNLTDGKAKLSFVVNNTTKYYNADLVVGADGIRSTVRKLTLGADYTTLNYLNLIVILGICSLSELQNSNTDLLDNETVFQTVNGSERIYMMPFTKDTVMWQLSFTMKEKDAIALSKKGNKALKEIAIRTTPWHAPIKEIVSNTPEDKITGYPVYDREPLKTEDLSLFNNITLLGDAAHPMSPFKGQGANQALLDALALARAITANTNGNEKCNPQKFEK